MPTSSCGHGATADPLGRLRTSFVGHTAGYCDRRAAGHSEGAVNERDPFRLDARTAVVTGAGRGIGAAVALELANAGANVGLVARTESELVDVADQVRAHGRRAVVVVADLSAEPDPSSVLAHIEAEIGSLDILVNNAGGATPAAFVDTDPSDLDAAFHFNVTKPFALVQAAVPHLLASDAAAVVNVSSNMGHVAQRGLVVYGTVKAAVSHMTRLLAADLSPRIRVNAVAPSVVQTEGVRAALTDEMRDQIVRATPLRRLATPQDVAWTVVWLASRASSYITGEVIELDGGAHWPTFPHDVPDVGRPV
jgi:7-alpha-hydroxysteroid dehydrogenase